MCHGTGHSGHGPALGLHCECGGRLGGVEPAWGVMKDVALAVIAVVIVAGLASRAVAPAVGCSVRCLRDDARVVGAVVVRLAIFPV